uniref:Uncharacterized protein n=1 Tax=Anguilla anguilla TaxID=7936 RepID=A0A0E9SKF1_ANGAN
MTHTLFSAPIFLLGWAGLG